MQNGVASKFKRSKLDIKTGHFVYLTFIIQMILCLFVSLFHVIYVMFHKEDFEHWIKIDKTDMFKLFFIKFGNWILILG